MTIIGTAVSACILKACAVTYQAEELHQIRQIPSMALSKSAREIETNESRVISKIVHIVKSRWS
jgi:hypothetical protein